MNFGVTSAVNVYAASCKLGKETNLTEKILPQ